MCEADKIETAFHVLSQESKELYLSSKITELYEKVSPLDFHRNYVSKNIPVIIRGGVKHWSATTKWTIPYFKSKLSDKLVNVAVTPDGYADAVAKERNQSGVGEEDFFIMPEERHMKMDTFLEELENPRDDRIYYIQRQDSNFEEFSELWRDIDSDIDWATKAFGTKPDAINFWMGDQRAITSSLHKDPYENIYCVISGEKEFILHPPTDLPWIPYKKYPSAIYKEIEKGKWITEPINKKKVHDSNSENLQCNKLSDEENLISWIAIDPLHPDYERYPKYKNTLKVNVTLKKGDILYLPSLWFHHVRQSHACIAINYWYDMNYDIKYAYYKCLETLCNNR